ncbi:hypothetical protein M2132_001000 [Dysgonomonas sp. PH5-45]|uniref:hypothetical protein n=1 Tax=unclassified Dysgonomonas TaxID=2630389 RepID=UPI002476DBA5|nr:MULTISPECIES: hypothetical protein [unclassified Dysgonomonas]MDH6354671.1 hypothetical protein [Dysgonomonas sp. PH5-45]MDH6387568.1 hypothetical protein [Dysgonomonas sp. PH5-37]
MRKILLFVIPILALNGCHSQNSVLENTIIDYLETDSKSGIRTDLKIKFVESEVSDILVSDSISILEKHYQEEYEKKLESAQKNVDHWQQSVAKHEKKKSDIVHKMLLAESTEKLNNAKSTLEEVKSWRPDYLGRYAGRDKNELIAKSVKCKLSFQNPKLSSRQELDATFIFSPDGQKIHEFIRGK